MTTRKVKAKAVYKPIQYRYKNYKSTYKKFFYFEDENGNKYIYDSDWQIGDTAYLVKKLNVPRWTTEWEYEIYPVKIEKYKDYNLTKTWYGKTRYLVCKIND